MDGSLFPEFDRRMREIRDLRGVLGLMSWDQETCLPPKAGAARGRQAATLEALVHERLCAPRLAELTLQLASDPNLGPERAAMVRILGREVARARRLPERWVRELALAQSAGLAAWREARQQRDFAIFAPALERLVALRREQAEALASGGRPYDALLQIYEPGARLSEIEPLFARLAAELSRLARAIAEIGRPSQRPFVGRPFDEGRQWQLSLRLLGAMGFDLAAGRLDRSAHPFTGGSHATDVRLTNRLRPDDPLPAIFGALHEGGHGLYEQGFASEIHGTSLAEAASLGLHESQSRLWENLIGRSLPFWRAFFPALRELFPEALSGESAESFHAAVNEVRATPIRVEADEVTYNLHIVLRLRLEVALIHGDLAVRDLPAAWSEGMRGLLGLVPRDDAEGVLQDIHWAWGEIGYFPTYTLGNLYSAILLRAAERELPTLWADVGRGELLGLREWLRRRIHAQGHLDEAEATVRAATGEGLHERPFVDYLWEKYGALYGVRRG